MTANAATGVLNVLVVADEAERSPVWAGAEGEGSPWTIWRASSAVDALTLLEQDRVDVVVAADRLADADGGWLLGNVSRRWPDVVRILVSRAGPGDAGVRSAAAQRHLAWPLEAASFASALAEAAALRGRLRGDAIERVVSRIDALPSAPAVWTELTACLADPDVGVPDVAAIIARDVAMSAKLLHLVNSPWSGLSRKLTRVDEAVSFLGLSTVRNLALSAAVAQMFDGPAVPGFSVDQLCSHGLACAWLARKVISDPVQRDDAFTAAMLQDIGQLALAQFLPDEVTAVRAEAGERGVPLHQVEILRWGATHAEIGAHLLASWELPQPVVASVAGHHSATPELAGGEVGLADAVVLARLLVQLDRPDVADPMDAVQPEDLEAWAEELGAGLLVPGWRDQAASF